MSQLNMPQVDFVVRNEYIVRAYHNDVILKVFPNIAVHFWHLVTLFEITIMHLFTYFSPGAANLNKRSERG